MSAFWSSKQTYQFSQKWLIVKKNWYVIQLQNIARRIELWTEVAVCHNGNWTKDTLLLSFRLFFSMLNNEIIITVRSAYECSQFMYLCCSLLMGLTIGAYKCHAERWSPASWILSDHSSLLCSVTKWAYFLHMVMCIFHILVHTRNIFSDTMQCKSVAWYAVQQ